MMRYFQFTQIKGKFSTKGDETTTYKREIPYRRNMNGLERNETNLDSSKIT